MGTNFFSGHAVARVLGKNDLDIGIALEMTISFRGREFLISIICRHNRVRITFS